MCFLLLFYEQVLASCQDCVAVVEKARKERNQQNKRHQKCMSSYVCPQSYSIFYFNCASQVQSCPLCLHIGRIHALNLWYMVSKCIYAPALWFRTSNVVVGSFFFFLYRKKKKKMMLWYLKGHCTTVAFSGDFRYLD